MSYETLSSAEKQVSVVCEGYFLAKESPLRNRNGIDGM
jgi:hypothetical protein